MQKQRITTASTNDTADNEHGAPAEHGQNDHVHSGGNQSTAVSDQANVGLVLTALRGRSELGEGGVACGERSAKAQTHEEAASRSGTLRRGRLQQRSRIR